MTGYSILHSCMYLLLQNGMTPLMWASAAGHLECVEALLRAAANLNLQANVSRVPRHEMLTCLLLMCVLVVCVTRKSDK